MLVEEIGGYMKAKQLLATKLWRDMKADIQKAGCKFSLEAYMGCFRSDYDLIIPYFTIQEIQYALCCVKNKDWEQSYVIMSLQNLSFNSPCGIGDF